MGLYVRLLAAGMRAKMQYKLDFMVSTVLYAMITLVDFLTVAAILYRYREVRGWDVYEVAVLSGVASSAYGLYRSMAAELESFERYLVNGEFDMLLIRPWPTLATLLSRNFDLGRLGAIVQGLVVLTIGLQGVGAPLWVRLYAYTLPLAGACIAVSNSLLAASAGFWVTRIADLQTLTINAPNAAQHYPMDIYPKWLRYLFLSLLPVACTSFVPMTYALGRGGHVWYLGVPYVAAGLALVFSTRLYRWG
ncbi:MAG TPA: ABC-2 family transporter protein, partial [Symbiobacteriaceae bacterium]|nr:ABC-2 family transporter protein [Symbiobacteriaceae bacterium]